MRISCVVLLVLKGLTRFRSAMSNVERKTRLCRGISKVGLSYGTAVENRVLSTHIHLIFFYSTTSLLLTSTGDAVKGVSAGAA